MKCIINFIKYINNTILKNLPLFNFIALSIAGIFAMKYIMPEKGFIVFNWIFGTGLFAIRDHINKHNVYGLTLKDLFKPIKYKYFFRFLKSKNIVASLGLLSIITTGMLEAMDLISYKTYLNQLLVIESVFFSILIIIGFCIESKEEEHKHVEIKE